MPTEAKLHFLTFFICVYKIFFYTCVGMPINKGKYAFQPSFCAFHRKNKVFSCLY